MGTASIYAGGNGQGFDATTTLAVTMGTASIYAGGSGQGFYATTTLAVTMGTARRYTGGSGDGFSSTLSTLQVMAIANTMFSGGNGDGFSSADLNWTYIFNSTGNWDINTNWQYCTTPPATLPTGEIGRAHV